MKSILYVGATLMIGASIYGFVDYSKTRNKKEFKNMYSGTEVKQPVFDGKLPSANSIATETPAVDPASTIEKKPTGNTVVTKRTDTKVKRQKQRTFNTRLFSRAALEEKYINEDKNKLEEPKTLTAPGKIVHKEPGEENKE